MRIAFKAAVLFLLLAGFAMATFPGKVAPEAKKHARHRHIVKIGAHLLDYDSEFAAYPSDLIALAEYGAPSGDLLIENKDGSIILPRYYPGRPYNKPECDLVVLKTTDGKGELVLSNRLNITFRPFPRPE